MNFPDEIKMISFEYQGQTHEIPLDAFATAMDKICYLAYNATKINLPMYFLWLDSEILIPITSLEFPYTNDPKELCAHLLYYGILDGFKFEFPAKKCRTIWLTGNQIGIYLKFAKDKGKTLFEWVFENMRPEPER